MSTTDNVSKAISNIKKKQNVYSIGRVSKIQNYVLEITGLDDAAYFEEVKIGSGSIGYVGGINQNYLSVVVVKKNGDISIGDEVISTGRDFSCRFSPDSLGKIVDMFGVDKMKNLEFANLVDLPLEEENTPIMDRSAVCRPLHTGVAGIDLIYPIGRGQRQLIIGDKKTGKTQIALDTIAANRDEDLICIYATIGKTKKEVREIQAGLTSNGAMSKTIIIAALNDELAPVLSLTPYAALAIATYYLKQKRDVLVIIDDLKRHADAYREIALLTEKTPGREAYPSDIFYTHARLLEKGCQHTNGGSITILPIVETKTADITDYISTNIISITDGQIVLSKKNFDKGYRPAIDYGLSVSRLGGAVQSRKVSQVGSRVKRELLSYMEKKDIYELANKDEMSAEMLSLLEKGERILDNLNQYKYTNRDEREVVDTFSNITIN